MTLRTPLCEQLGIEVPVFLAGMGGVSYHRLAAAVSEAGGFGCLGASTMTHPEMVDEMAKVRELTAKPFGVDLLTAIPGQVEAQIARTLTADIFRAEDRALGSINRELFTQQQELAQRIRAIKPALLEQQRAALIADRPAKTAGDAIRPSPRRAVPL